jgi:uncharacterized protein YegL
MAKTKNIKKKQKTYVAIILDKSGSMAGTKAQTIAGFNEQVQETKKNAKDQDIFCSLVTFDGEVYEHLWNVPANDLSEATAEAYKPTGATAMRDAMGYTIQKLLNTTDHDNEDNSYLIIAISDGDTNSDKHYNPAALKEMVEACRGTGRWTFTYMGCTKEYVEKIARETSIPLANVAAWSNSTADAAIAGMSNQRKRLSKFYGARGQGVKACANYMSDVVGASADFTEDHEVSDAPVVTEIVATGPTDWSNLLSKLPKYQKDDGHRVVVENGGVFTNTAKVLWEKDADQDLANQHGLGATNFGAATISNVTRRGRK